MSLLTLSTPINQVTYNTIEDQYNYELNNIVLNNPSIYISRLIERLFAGVTSTDWVANGLDVTFNLASLNTNSLSFTVGAGLMMIDSSLIKIGSTDVIVSSVPAPFPSVSGSSTANQYMIAIFANYSFSTAGSTVVTYSSYVMDRAKVLKSPTIFAGTEKILLAVFDVVSDGTVWTSIIRQNARWIREIEPFLPDAPMENTLTFGATTYAVRGASNILASILAFKLAKQQENVFILDSLLYKPFDPYLQWEVTGMFQ
jgi:hypothetical protein